LRVVTAHVEVPADRVDEGERRWLSVHIAEHIRSEIAGHDDRSSGGRCLRQRGQSFPGDRIKNDAGADAACDLFHARHEVFVLHDDHIVRAETEQLFLLSLGPRRGDDLRAFRLRYVDSGQAHAAAGSRQEHEVAFGKLLVLDQRAVGCEIGHPDRCALLEREAMVSQSL